MREAPAKGYPTRGLQVWANADYPKDAQRACSYGAVGIGLCRTEHMFFEPERLPIVQEMILSETSEGGRKHSTSFSPTSARTSTVCSRRWMATRSSSA